MWITINCGKILKRLEIADHFPVSWEACMQDKKQHLELDMEQQTGSKSVKKYAKTVLSPCLFNFCAEYIMQNAGLDDSQAESRLLGELRIPSDMQMTPL